MEAQVTEGVLLRRQPEPKHMRWPGIESGVNCLEGSYAHHYTTNAVSSQQLAPSLRRLEVHESPIGLEEQMRSLFGPVTKESLQEFASRHVQENAAFPSG